VPALAGGGTVQQRSTEFEGGRIALRVIFVCKRSAVPQVSYHIKVVAHCSGGYPGESLQNLNFRPARQTNANTIPRVTPDDRRDAGIDQR